MRARPALAAALTLAATATAVTVAAGPATAAAPLTGLAWPTVVTVAADGRGDFTTVQAAVDAAPAANTTPYLVLIRPGTYKEIIKVPSDKPYLSFVGLGRSPRDVVLTYDNANGTPKPDGTGTYGTSGSASVTIDGHDFTARNLTFENAFDEAAHPEITGRQSVAVLTRADRIVFDKVRFLSNQDTLYLNSTAATVVARVALHDCYVEGDVDFIFGRATAVFDGCTIHSLDRGSTTNNGYVVAPSTDINNRYGFLFQRSRLTGATTAATVYLGRPWHPSNDPNAVGQVLFRDTWLGGHIRPDAWSDFSGGWSWRDARFFEHRTRGPGAVVSDDRPQLPADQVAEFTAEKYLAGTDGWDPLRYCW
ncbi:pectinesterase family protein [Luedemannella flava]|uniref:Pectinesterase n=1 Tax=Luedemannella flava TaxID=349316 RepID=A0ABN2MBD3_9ACTN